MCSRSLLVRLLRTPENRWGTLGCARKRQRAHLGRGTSWEGCACAWGWEQEVSGTSSPPRRCIKPGGPSERSFRAETRAQKGADARFARSEAGLDPPAQDEPDLMMPPSGATTLCDSGAFGPSLGRTAEAQSSVLAQEPQRVNIPQVLKEVTKKVVWLKSPDSSLLFPTIMLENHIGTGRLIPSTAVTPASFKDSLLALMKQAAMLERPT
nr:uncharacterized protein LOC123284675 isoform X2 [Equus asinus]